MAFYWVVVSSLVLLFLFPRVNVFLGFRGCDEAFAKTRGVFFWAIFVALYLLEFHLLQ